MPSEESRYEEISRRAFLKRGAAVGIAVAIPSVFLAACGSDAATFSSASGAGTTTPTTGVAGAAGTTTTDPTTTSTNALAANGALLPVGAELVVDFTYEAGSTSRGGVKNPYVAVWVEDEAGELVATVALWFLQSRKGLEWLNDLRRWATVDGSESTIDAISSATRAPGDYRVVWDGTSTGGERVPQGTYYLAIEAAREHGPYSLIREAVTLGDQAFSQTLEAEGELSNAAVSLVLA